MSTGKNKNKNKKRGNNRRVQSNNTEKTKDRTVETRWSFIVKWLLSIFTWLPFVRQKSDNARCTNENKSIPSSSKHQDVDDQARSKKKSSEKKTTDLLKQEDRQNGNETKTIIAQLTKRNTDLEKQLKHHEEKYEQSKAKKEQLKDNFKDYERKLNASIKEQRDKIDILEKECTKCTGTYAGLKERNSKLRKDLERQEDTYRQMLSEKEKQIKHLEDKAREMKVTLNERGATITKSNETINKLTEQNIKVDQEIAHFTKHISNMETEIQHYKKVVSEKCTQIDSLMAQNKTLEEEKQDALRRLSAMMSVKLRDNNPNIADLSDQFRPTKLGEQFSELYDNEWTDAFDALQSSVGERHAISFLLDIVMESYEFCDQKLSEEWMFAKSWFIVETAQTAQQTLRSLKDGRKQKIIERVSEIEQKYAAYLLEICSNETLTGLVKSGAVRNYISTCIKLTLLMTANDPPVVIQCPDWQRCSERPFQEDAWSHKVSDASSKDHKEHCEPDVVKDSTMVTESPTLEKPNTKQDDNEIHTKKDKHVSENDNTYDAIMNVSLPDCNANKEEMLKHDFVSHASTSSEESKISPADMTGEGHSASDNDVYKHDVSKTEEMQTKITDVVSAEAYLTADNSVKEDQQADSREKELTYQNTHTKQHDHEMHANTDYQLCDESNAHDAVDVVINEPTPASSGLEDDFHNHDLASSESMCSEGRSTCLNDLTSYAHTATDIDRQTSDLKSTSEMPLHQTEQPSDGTDIYTGIKYNEEHRTNLHKNKNDTKNDGSQDNESMLTSNNRPNEDVPSVLETNTVDDLVGAFHELSILEKKGTEQDLSGSETYTTRDNENEMDVENAMLAVKTTLKIHGPNQYLDQRTKDGTGFSKTINPIEKDTVNLSVSKRVNPTPQNQRIVHEVDNDENTNEKAKNPLPTNEIKKEDTQGILANKDSDIVHCKNVVKERPSFDKDNFKEYTSRGPYVDYFVWPIMYLHRDGPMLGKGIAQGAKGKMEDVYTNPFVWWKRLSKSQKLPHKSS